jgi:hypothetical protein
MASPFLDFCLGRTVTSQESHRANGHKRHRNGFRNNYDVRTGGEIGRDLRAALGVVIDAEFIN